MAASQDSHGADGNSIPGGEPVHHSAFYHRQPKWVKAALGKSLIISPKRANVVVVSSRKKTKGVTAKESEISRWLVSPAKRALKKI